MSGYAVARLEDIEEIRDGLACRPVRHHFGLTSFGVNTWTGVAVGDRILNERAQRVGQLVLAKRELLAYVDLRRTPAEAYNEQLAVRRSHPVIRLIK